MTKPNRKTPEKPMKNIASCADFEITNSVLIAEKKKSIEHETRNFPLKNSFSKQAVAFHLHSFTLNFSISMILLLTRLRNSVVDEYMPSKSMSYLQRQ